LKKKLKYPPRPERRRENTIAVYRRTKEEETSFFGIVVEVLCFDSRETYKGF